MKDSADGSSYSNPKLSLANIPALENLDWVALPVVMSEFSLQGNPNLECDLWSLPVMEAYTVEISGNPKIDNCAAFDWAEAMVDEDWQNQVRDNGPCLK